MNKRSAGISETGTSDLQDVIRTARYNLIKEELFPAAIALGLIFTLLAGFYLNWVVSKFCTIGSLVAGGTALVFFLAAPVLRRQQFDRRWSHVIGLSMAVLALGNALTYLIISGEAWTTTGIMLVVIGCGFLFLSTINLTIIIILSVISWLYVAWFNLGQHVWAYFGFTFILSIIVSYVVHLARLKMVEHGEVLRLKAEAEAQKAEQTLEALHDQESLYRDLFENANDMIQSIDTNGHYIYVNRSWHETLGYTEEDLKTITYKDIIDPREHAKCDAIIDQVMHQESVSSIETVFLTKDRQPIYVEGNISAQFKDGQFNATRGIFRNITMRKQVEESLFQERILLRTVIDNLPDAIYAKDLKARKILINKADLANTAKSEEEVLGKTDLEVYPQEVAERFIADDLAVIQSGQPVVNREEMLINQAGEKKWILTSKVPLRDTLNNIVGLVGIGRDITEQKAANKRMLEMHELLRDLNDKLAMAYEESRRQRDELMAYLRGEQSALLLDSIGKIIGITEKTISLTGYSRLELIGKNIKDIVESELSLKLDNLLKVVNISGFKNIDLQIYQAGGGLKKIYLSLNRISLDKEKLLLAIITEK
jgi:PAS domain S-box-containing protein